MSNFIRMGVALVILFAVDVGSAHAARLRCVNPDTDESVTTTPAAVKRSIRLLRRKMRKRAILFTDLSANAQRSRRRIDKALAENSWCTVLFDLRDIEDAVQLIRVDSDFTLAKFTTLDRWLRTADFDRRQRTRAQNHVNRGAALIAKGGYVMANKALNRAVVALLHVADGWQIPPAMPVVSRGELKDVRVSNTEVAEACPNVRPATPLGPMVRRLRTVMNDRRIRLTDYRAGPTLLRDLNHYRRLGARWPAVRVVCAMIHRTTEVNISVGLLTGRLMRLDGLRKERALSDARDEEFRVRVRAITDAMGISDFTTAHRLSEGLTVMMGDRKMPGAEIR